MAFRLVGGPAIDPPCTYQGGKRRYASAILGALGLRPGQGASRVVLCDAGTWGLAWERWAHAPEAVEVLRQWASEGRDRREHFALLAGLPPPSDPAVWLATLLELQDAVFGGAPIVCREKWHTHGFKGENNRSTTAGLACRLARAASVQWPGLEVYHRSATELDPVALGVDAETVCFVDPPYSGVTGYGASLSRAEVVAIALRFSAAGATVAVSEGEPVAELVAEGWHTLDITAAHHGQPRTFTKSRGEWLTMNRPPVRRVPGQLTLL